MKNIIITILTVLVLCLGGYLIYDKVINKTTEPKENNNEEKTANKDSNLNKVEINSFINKTNYYKVNGEKVKLTCEDQYAYISLNLPTLYIDGTEYTSLKSKVENDFKHSIELANKDDFSDVSSKNYSITNIDYSSFYKDDLLIINITEESKGCASSFAKPITTYVIDIANKKILTVEEILKKYGIDKTDVKQRFINERNENSIVSVNEVLKENFSKYVDDLNEEYFSIVIDKDGAIQIWFDVVESIIYHV